MSGLNILSLLAVLAVGAIAVRRVHKVLHLAPVLLCSLLGAWVVTTLAFERVHVLVFVVGSLLGGVAVDYGFYLFLQPPRRPDETYLEKVARLLKPLLASALTTILGFSLLLFSELPLIRQLGVFVSAGLLSALAGALLWFAQVDEMFLETRAFIRPKAGGIGYAFTRVVLFFALLVALTGPWLLHWRDDIRSLEIPSPDLTQEALAVRAMFGETQGSSLFLTRGNNPAEARAALEHFKETCKKADPDASFASLGLALPTQEQWALHLDQSESLAKFPEALRKALGRHGFDPESFSPFFQAWAEHRAQQTNPSLDDLTRDLNGVLRGPLSLMMGQEQGTCWFASLVSLPSGREFPLEQGTVSAAQLQSFNQLFSRYRVSALHLSAIGLSLVGLSVFVLYGPRRGIRIFAIPAGSCLFAFGVFGLLGVTMNLFHLLGAFLGVCLSHNYAIFSAENAARGDAPPPSIRLSALTTAASFGVLALSKIPVVAALGSMVALIVMGALIAVELDPFSQLRKPCP